MPEPILGHPGRTVYLWLGVIAAVAVILRLAAIPLVAAPFPVDASYYADVGYNLALGRGLTVDYLWNYARGVPDRLPMPSNGYWMPGMSFYLWPWFRLLGPTFRASQLATVFLSSVFVLLTWQIARELFADETTALLAAAFAAVDPVLMEYSTTPDATLLQSALVAGSLLCSHRALRANVAWLGLAGLLAGLAHLVRNDGALVVPALLLTWVAPWRGSGSLRLRHMAWLVAPYAMVMAPWMIRNTVVFGSPSPPGVWRLAFLPIYEDMYRSDWSSLTMGAWLAARGGWGGVLSHDVSALGSYARWVVTDAGGVLLLFAIPLLWVRRPAVALPFLYLLGLCALVYGFVLPEIGLHGAFVRSFIFAMPVIWAAGASGLSIAAEWTARRLPRTRHRLVLGALAAILLVHGVGRQSAAMLKRREVISVHPYLTASAELRLFFDSHPPTGRPLLTGGPWDLYRITGRPCLMAPTDGMGRLLEIADRFGVRYLVITGAGHRFVPGLDDALREARVRVVREIPTLVDVGDLQIIDLRPAPAPAAGGPRARAEPGYSKQSH